MTRDRWTATANPLGQRAPDLCIEPIARVDVSCRALIRLPRYVFEWGMNRCAREVARSLRDYFDEALEFHRNAQEAHLFPALLAHLHEADGSRALLTTFEAEHRALEKEWESLCASLTAVALCRPARLSIDETARLRRFIVSTWLPRRGICWHLSGLVRKTPFGIAKVMQLGCAYRHARCSGENDRR